LLELAQDWSSYYAVNSVLQAETPELISARVALAEKVLRVLEKGMKILGFQAPERM
jgi:arginyl-tRNA synthetase